MKTSVLATVFLSVCLLNGSFANAAAKIGDVEVNSCEITSPFKLKPIEADALAKKGYRLRVSRSSFRQQSYSGVYEYYELKENKLAVRSLYLRAVLAPHDLSTSHLLSEREFSVFVVMPSYARLIELATSTPPSLAHSKEEAENADFSKVAACRED